MSDEHERGASEAAAEVKDPHLSIGQFARRSLLSPKALRLYDRQGLLAPAEVDPVNGYRRYRESQLADARLIARLRKLDMPLADVATVIAAPEERRSDVLMAYWDAVERRVAAQRDLLTYVLIQLAGKERNFDMFEIEERDVAEQTVLTEQRHTTVNGLTEWFDDCMPRLHTLAANNGGVAGAAFIIYHGEVNEESDGPVEVCVPIDPARREKLAAPTRVEPAHREAYTQIRKSLVEYPQILTAYDAVEQWITKNGKRVAGSPREVYFADFVNAGPDDEVVDIAFPIA
ncbi:MAG: MerR family transcriptional regulator [Chloroflexota bacterium]|nr:MerR family transcriptional regulator [Chloroflexota bacterium]